MIKKADIILGVFLTLICLSSLFLLGLADTGATTVTIAADGRTYGTYDLSKDQTITVEQKGTHRHNVVKIQDGSILMEESSCANQVCVNQGSISRSNQTIVCLPNKVVVTISGGDAEMDAVAY